MAKSLQVKRAAVKLSAPRIPRVGDHAVELPLSVQTSHGRVYESVLYVQLERIVGVFVIAGARPVTAADSRRLATATVLHIDKALTPQVYRVPEVTGNAQQGETLTSDTGTWDTLATFAYQWQRCDETASSCTDIPGATSRLVHSRSRGRQLPAPGRGERGKSLRHGRRGFGSDRKSDPAARSGSTMSANKTYGGAMASTWSVLRVSCKRRSPVGLLKQPEPNASADSNLALAA